MKKYSVVLYMLAAALCICGFTSCVKEKGVVTYVAVADYEMPGFTYTVGMGIEFDQDAKTFVTQKTAKVGEFVLEPLAPIAKGTWKGSLSKDGTLILTTTSIPDESGQWIELSRNEYVTEEYLMKDGKIDVIADDGSVITSFVKEE